MPLVPPLLLALALGAAPLGCAHDQAPLKAPEKEQLDLGARAEDFWRAVRWADVARAAEVIEEDEARMSWTSVAEAELVGLRIQEATYLDLSLGPLTTDPQARRLQQATVRLKVQSYALPAQVLQERVVVQRWYRSRRGWFLDWDGGDPLALEPQPL